MALVQKASQFLSEVKTEMSKVSWPEFESLKGSTWVVIALSLAFAVYIFLIDQGLTQIIKLIY